MTMFTKVSGKGQVVLPKGMRDLKNWPLGTELEVIDAGDGVLLRPRVPARVKTLTPEQAVDRFRAIYRHHGPPIPIEQLGWRMDVDDRP